MKSDIIGIIFGIMIFFVCQMFVPFPYGLVVGIVLAGIVILFSVKRANRGKDSILNYRRIDPINDDERKQNDEALRILEKKYIEEKISKEEYMKRKKEFEETEYNPRKCKECGSEDFEFVAKDESEKSSEGYYKCKKCGKIES